MDWMDRKKIWLGVVTIALLVFTSPLLFQWGSNPPRSIPSENTTTTIPPPPGDTETNETILPPPPDSNTTPILQGQLSIDSIGDFTFDPRNIKSIRPDLFNPGYFFLFDILVFLDNQSEIQLDYSFNASLDTHTIHTINGVANWWYRAYYSGGWWEKNYFRMDYYPYKDKMAIRVLQESIDFFDTLYGVFKEEVQRKASNNGSVIVPIVKLEGPANVVLTFYNVTVTANNIRSDVFQPGVITTIDTILSLDNQGEIDSGITWYESIGTAEIVKTYYVEKINDWVAYGTCGFVYEAGDTDQNNWRGNHIHIPSDSRIVLSPEYVLYFWICL